MLGSKFDISMISCSISFYHKDDREEGRLKGDLKRIRLEREELKERMNDYEVCRDYT